MSWLSNEGTVTGNPIGIGSNMTFSGSGELDNGTTFSLSIAHTNKAAYSSTNVTMDTPSMGSFRISQGVSGAGLDRIDDMMPTAWEETHGAGLGTGIDNISGNAGAANVEWTPNSDMLPEGITLHVLMAPSGGGSSNDKGSSGDNGGVGSGYDVVVKHSGIMDGLNVFAGMSNTEQANLATDSKTGDKTEYSMGATYSSGAWTLGYQVMRENVQTRTAAGTSFYDNTAWGVAFNVNDDLSISYGEFESEKANNGAANVTAEARSIQLAYSMGGASLRLAENSVDNAQYSTAVNKDMDGTTISLALAF